MRRDSAVVGRVPGRTVLVAFGQEVVASCPFGCMVQVVERDRAAVHLDDSCLASTCWCCCRLAELEGRLADIDLRVRQLHIVPGQPNGPALCEPELAQLGLVACSKLQLAVAVACLELAIG